MNSIRHVAIIMDGNGRWAEQRGWPRWRGHEAGARAVRRTVEAACRLEIPVLTLFAFSSENWKRPPQEVQTLFRLFLKYVAEETQSMVENGIRLSAFGRRDRISPAVVTALSQVESATRGCTRLHLRLALDYGSRHEVVEAVQALAQQVASRTLMPEDIDEQMFTNTLTSRDVPDPDLVIRTAGEQRLSNFLLWQAAYAELHFCPRLWPDFDESDLQEALDDYHSRTRKFGALPCVTGALV
ncbi:MAG: di-trans,poly-cis-decaprenylcistransferase [Acidobacteriia bacterium]|nr:di-trans,poly-cis-decaprenylcistransferase [Terriglobia bacterium]